MEVVRQDAFFSALRSISPTATRSGYIHEGYGGPARYLIRVSNQGELIDAVRAAISHTISYRVLGSATRSMLSDSGYEGLVILNETNGIILDRQKSIATVDAGARLRSLCLEAAAHDMAGLLHLYRYERGSVSGLLVRGGFQPHPTFSSLIRSLTVFLPPSRRRPEGGLVTVQGSWLSQESHRLSSDLYPYPVLVSMQLQLTALRGDEIQRRLKVQVEKVHEREPGSAQRVIGPVFAESEAYDITNLLTLCAGMREGSVYWSRSHPNFIHTDGLVRSRDVASLVSRTKDMVNNTYGVALQSCISVYGAYPDGYTSTNGVHERQ